MNEDMRNITLFNCCEIYLNQVFSYCKINSLCNFYNIFICKSKSELIGSSKPTSVNNWIP